MAFHHLPREIIFRIVEYVYCDFDSQSLGNSLLSCKVFYHIALPIFYSRIRLDSESLDTLPPRVAVFKLVKNLTVVIGKLKHGSLSHAISKLSNVLESMACLETFSFTVEEKTFRGEECSVIQSIMVDLLDFLPTTCKNLEMDGGKCHGISSAKHFCDHFRKRLPQLCHVKIRLYEVCPRLLVEMDKDQSMVNDLSKSQTVIAPQLKSLIFNCIPGAIFNSCTKICEPFMGIQQQSPSTFQKAHLMLASLMHFALESSSYPVAENLLVVFSAEMPHSLIDDTSWYNTVNRINVLDDNKVLLMPFRNALSSTGKNTWLVRVSNLQEFITTPANIEILAQGEYWVQTTSGHRIPRDRYSKTKGVALEDLPVQTKEVWKRENPKKTCVLWRNEEVTGCCLLRAVYRDEMHDASPLRELVPPGWRREYDGFLERIHRT